MDTDSRATTSLEQLETMLALGEISQQDYDTLRDAMKASPARSPEPPTVMPARPTLRKSWDNRELGGVCAGLAERMGIEPRIVRIVFVVGAFLTGAGAVLIYVVLYAFLPWKESEADRVTRFSYRFAAWVFGLWLVLLGALGLVQWQGARLFGQFGGTLPVLTRDLVEFGRVTPLTLALQACVLFLLVNAYALAPSSGYTRKVVAWVTIGAELLVLLLVLLGTYLPLG
jgi:phage shock protein PspC (stress-responsive transcriptional regulator)